MAGASSGLSTELLTKDPNNWFAPGERAKAARRAMDKTIDNLSKDAGQDKPKWNWGTYIKYTSTIPSQR
ncbi:MAG: hypothetical protein Ct9H300mP19_13080 [Dehalococcoidia bacterium]|nr:MAG: hypothetical protein Ct9H300mP19_13080 [Dehalococcoidia bacterium]